MSYWLAPALETLRDEINSLAPNRDRRSDGWIGDKRHAGSKSDHNPSNWPGSWTGVVRAFDFDNDLGNGRDGSTLWDALVPMLGRHAALGSGAYLIYRSRIISTDRLDEGARRYSGTNPHDGHIHVSVGTSAAAYNSTAPWGVMEDDMPLDAVRDYEAFKVMLWRAFKWDLRPGDAPGPDWTKGPTVWEYLTTIVNEVRGISATDPKEIAQQVVALLPEDGAEAVLDALAEIIKERGAA